MHTRIFYFSGTGNSLHAARELGRRLTDAALIPLLRWKDEEAIAGDADAIGFVFPQHGGQMPKIVAALIRRMNLKAAAYLFAVATRGGTPCRAFSELDEILAGSGRKLDACFVLTMPSGSEPLVETYARSITPPRLARLEAEMLARLDEIAALVAARASHRSENLDGVDLTPPAFMKPLLPLLTRLEPALRPLARAVESGYRFYADGRCTACGLCAQVCLSGKIVVRDGRPEWQPAVECYGCFACLNYCPEESVQIKDTWYMKSCTPVNGRYHHPQVDAADIAAQKSDS